MQSIKTLCVLLAATALFAGCQKEIHFTTNPSQGSLQADGSGDCLSKSVNGTYTAGTALQPSTNTIDISVDVTVVGAYLIHSDTLNGYSFAGIGDFSSTGLHTVTLHGSGNPSAAGTNHFTITYNGTSCSVPVIVGTGGGGGTPATFTLTGSPNACSATINGTYTSGLALDNSNTVSISVDVATAGTYSITTTATNGITFSKSGTFATTGTTTIILTGTGTPVTAGTTSVPVTAGASSCSFDVPVANAGAAAQYTIDCSSISANGTYVTGTALDGTNTIDLDVDVTAIGTYHLTVTGGGMTFTKSGSFTTIGTSSITLAGTGTPTAPGDVDLAFPNSCSFPLTVENATLINWKFTIGSTTYQGTMDASQINASGVVTAYTFQGSNANAQFLIELIDVAGGIQSNETYNTSSVSSNSGVFLYSPDTGTDYSADFSSSAVNLVIKITSHNTGTKTITGTFSGTVKDDSGTVFNVTNGTFGGVYQ